MPSFFTNKINKTVLANYSRCTVCCNCKKTFSINEPEVEESLIVGTLIVETLESYYFTNAEISNLAKIVTKYSVAKFKNINT